MTQQTKKAKDVAARKGRSISSTAEEWHEISVRAKSAKQSISDYALKKSMNPPASLFGKAPKRSKPLTARESPTGQVLVLTPDQQDDLLDTVKELAKRDEKTLKTDEKTLKIAGYGDISALECIAAIFLTMFDYMQESGNEAYFSDILGKVLTPRDSE